MDSFQAQTKASDLVTEKVKLRENLTRREQEWKKMIEPFLREVGAIIALFT